MAELREDPQLLSPISIEQEKAQIEEAESQALSLAIEEALQSAGKVVDIDFQKLPTFSSLQRRRLNRIISQTRDSVNHILKEASNNAEPFLSDLPYPEGDFYRLILTQAPATIDLITHAQPASEISLSILEQSENFLLRAREQVTQEVEKAKADYQASLEQLSGLKKYFARWNIASFERFSQDLDFRLEDLFSEIQNRIAENKNTLSTQVENIQQFIENKLTKGSLQEKDTLLKAIEDALFANAVNNIDTAPFHLADTPQNKINILEAIKKSSLLRDYQHTKHLSEARASHQENLITQARNLEQIAEQDFQHFKPHRLQDIAPFFEGISPANPPTTTEALSQTLEAEISRYQDLNALFPTDNYALITPALKVKVFLEFLFEDGRRIEHLAPQAKSKLLSWLKAQEESLTQSFEIYDNAPAKTHLESLLTKRNAIFPRLKAFLEKTQAFFDEPANAPLSLDELTKEWSSLHVAIEDQYQSYLNLQPLLPEEDQRLLNRLWQVVLEVKDRINNLQESLTKSHTTEIQELENKLQHLQSNPPSEPKEIPLHQQKIARIENQIKTLKEEREKSKHALSQSLGTLEAYLREKVKYASSLTPAKSPSVPLLHHAIQEGLHKDFAREVEKSFLKQWEQNDQYELLKNLTFGRVRISYKEVGVASHLHFPKQLSGLTEKTFRLNKVIGDTIELVEEGVPHPKILRITRKAIDFSESEPVVYKNGALFESHPHTNAGTTPRFVIVTNIHIL